MTLQQMQEASKRRNEAIIGAWTDKPTGYTAEILDQYKTAYKSITETLKDTYAKHLSGVNPEDQGYYNAMLKYNRHAVLQQSVTKDYTQAARRAAKIQFEAGETAFSNLYYDNMFSVNWFSENPYFAIVDKKAVQVSVYATPEIWQSIKEASRAKYSPYLPKYGTLSNLLEANAASDLKRISQAITQGLIKGESYTSVARDLRNIFNTTGSNAIRIARTEGNRNLNSGAYANSQAAADSGVDLKRMYMATLDTRTREQSGAMDGQTRAVDKPFTYGGYSWFIPGNSGNPAYDINDRCTVIDVIDGKPPELRRGRNPVTGETEVASFGSFDDWMNDNNLTRNQAGRIVEK